MRPRPLAPVLLLALAGPAACAPYAVGHTAQPVPRGEHRSYVTMYGMGDGYDLDGDDVQMPGIDFEARIGMRDGVDVGMRIPSLSGIVVSSKVRVLGGSDPGDGAVALMGGVGGLAYFTVTHAEGAIMASAPRWRGITPYAGARIMGQWYVRAGGDDIPATRGAYVGLRLGNDNGAVTPELGVYRNRGSRDYCCEYAAGGRVVIPSVTLELNLLGVIAEARQWRARAARTARRAAPAAR